MSLNTEKFIREIENRNAIWDISSEEYSDRNIKKRAWEEITNLMSDQENLTEKEKNEFGKSLQQKWKNIRTSFSREINRQAGAESGSSASRKSPYVYFEQLQFVKATVLNNQTQNSMEETHNAENNDDSDDIQSESIRDERIKRDRHVPKKKKKSEEESLLEVLGESIAVREEREKKQESDSDRLFLLSLLEDFKNIHTNRKLSTKMELIGVMKRAQLRSVETHNYSEFGLLRPVNSDYETGTSAPRSNRPETSVSGQYRHGYSTEYGQETSISGQYQSGYSTDNLQETSSSGHYHHRYSEQTNVYVTNTSQNSEILELFNENSLSQL